MRLFLSVSVAGIACGILFGSGGDLSAEIVGESEWPQIARPLDIPAERLERPRPEQDRPSRPPSSPTLSQAEVIKLAQAEARKELGKRFDEYEVKSVIFDSTTGLWSVTLDRNPPHRALGGCLIVFVHDNDKTADLQRCL
ncbi:MAG: hypothetical protein ABL970_18650 [Nitrospira sp.]